MFLGLLKYFDLLSSVYNSDIVCFLQILSLKYFEKSFWAFFTLRLPFDVSTKFSPFLLVCFLVDKAHLVSFQSLVYFLVWNFLFCRRFIVFFQSWSSNIFLSGGIFRKCHSILFKIRIGVISPITFLRMFFLCVFLIKKSHSL